MHVVTKQVYLNELRTDVNLNMGMEQFRSLLN